MRAVNIRRGSRIARIEAGQRLAPIRRKTSFYGFFNMIGLIDQAQRGVDLRDRAAAGVAPFTPHDMRRTYIFELLDAGAELATVQKMVGHESVMTTAG